MLIPGLQLVLLLPEDFEADYAEHTIVPHEIIVVDQTPQSERISICQDLADCLPCWINLNSWPNARLRNEGLKQASGDFILFVDDDDEVPPDLIERHLKNLLLLLQCSVSNGAALEPARRNCLKIFVFLD